MRDITRFPNEWDWYEDFTVPAQIDPLAIIEGLEARWKATWAWIDSLRRREVPYAEYLQSDWWQQVRRQRLWFAEWQCEYHDWKTGRRCTAIDGLDVHHLTYERIGDENWDTDLIVLCRKHHQTVHRKEHP